MKGRQGNSFTVEHPLHFSADAPMAPARATPYGPNRSFPASALLYTPLLFRGMRVGGLQLDSRLYLSSSRWVEEALWLMPFATTGEGRSPGSPIATNNSPNACGRPLDQPGSGAPDGVPELPHRWAQPAGARRLFRRLRRGHHSQDVALPAQGGSDGREWGRVAFTHFRPGGATAKSYRDVGTAANWRPITSSPAPT